MSTLDFIQAAVDAEFSHAPEDREVLVRNFMAELAPGDGRTLDIRITPYNSAATVADPPEFVPYQEMFLPGAFERQAKAPDRVKIWLNFEHQQGLQGIIGHGLELHDRADALYGSFRVHDTADGEKALQLVRDKVLTGTSLEFAPLKSRVSAGVVQRLRAHIDKVSLCLAGKEAYKEAGVVAVRTEPVVLPLPEPLSEGLAHRLAALNVELLDRVTVVRSVWDGSQARFSDEEYQRSCLVDRGGDATAFERCSLPVLEPNGDLNANALIAAASALAGSRVNADRTLKGAAARKLIRYYRMADMRPPASISALAGSA